MGARPMARVIQENIKKPLADEVLFGKLQSGGTVRILLEVDPATGEEKLGFRYLSRDEEKALPRPPERKALPRASNGGGGPTAMRNAARPRSRAGRRAASPSRPDRQAVGRVGSKNTRSLPICLTARLPRLRKNATTRPRLAPASAPSAGLRSMHLLQGFFAWTEQPPRHASPRHRATLARLLGHPRRCRCSLTGRLNPPPAAPVVRALRDPGLRERVGQLVRNILSTIAHMRRLLQ